MPEKNNEEIASHPLLTLCYQLTLQDYLATQESSIEYFMGIVVLVFLFVLNYWGMWPAFAVPEPDFSRSNIAILCYSTAAVALLLTVIFNSKLSPIWNRVQRHSWEQSRFSDSPRILEFSELGVLFEAGEIKGTRPWENYMELEVRQTIFLLSYISHHDDNYHIIPKSAFATDEQLIDFRNLLRRKHVSILDIYRQLPTQADL